MNTYTISFYGRNVGALGVTQAFDITLKAENDSDAITRLYERYEHITSIRIIRTPTTEL